jgi:putative ABC transport system permease protein
MYKIALKMLVGDRAKYLLLVSALSFATLLMTQQGAVFFGLLRWTTATIRNTNVPIWVVDPLVEQVNEIQPLRDTDLARVRSVKGVEWAVPLYFSIQQARLTNGKFKPVQLMGLDATTLVGAPTEMLEGRLESLWQANSVIIDEVGVERLSISPEQPITIGDTFEINDYEARVVGICKAERSFFGYPYVYTTYERAVQFAPPVRKTLSYILAKPQEGYTNEEVTTAIEKNTGLRAYTEEDFKVSTVDWYFENTGIPITFGTTILLGFLVGVAVSGQTFYSFVLENLPHLGALKAMGASNTTLRRMLLFQALFVGFIGYGVGIGLTSIFGRMTLTTQRLPFYMPYEIMAVSFAAIISICIFAAMLGIRKVQKLDAAEVFRG